MARYYTIFNVEQCDGIEYPKPGAEPCATSSPSKRCDQLVAGYAVGPEIRHGEQPRPAGPIDVVVVGVHPRVVARTPDDYPAHAQTSAGLEYPKSTAGLAVRESAEKPMISAGWTGLEPAASGVTGRRYNQLNYHPRTRGGRGSEPGGSIYLPAAAGVNSETRQQLLGGLCGRAASGMRSGTSSSGGADPRPYPLRGRRGRGRSLPAALGGAIAGVLESRGWSRGGRPGSRRPRRRWRRPPRRGGLPPRWRRPAAGLASACSSRSTSSNL